MSTQRYINTGFWSDEYIEELDPLERYLFMYCLTNPLTNIAGIYRISLKRMSFETGIDKEMIVKMILRFTEADKIAYIDNHIVIKNFIKHQKPTPNIQKGIDKILSDISENIQNWLKDGKALEGIESLSKVSNYLNKNTNKNTNINNNTNEDKEEFERFWLLYDYKKKKPEAIKLWNKLNKIDKDNIFKNIPLYKQSQPNKQFRVHPPKYLKNRVWEDEITSDIPEKSFNNQVQDGDIVYTEGF